MKRPRGKPKHYSPAEIKKRTKRLMEARDGGTTEKVAGKVQNKVGDVKKVFGK